MFNRVKKAEMAVSHLMVNTNKEIEIIKKKNQMKTVEISRVFSNVFQ